MSEDYTLMRVPLSHVSLVQAVLDGAENRLGRVTEELGLPDDATGSRILEAIRTYADFERSMGFFDGRDRAVQVLMRKANACADDDLTPIEEAIREQLIYASREIRELKPKEAASDG